MVHECFVDWQCICINTFWFNCTVCILGIWKKKSLHTNKILQGLEKNYFILFNVISGFAGTSFAFRTSFDGFCTKCNKLPNHQVKNKVSSHLLACMILTRLEDKLSYFQATNSFESPHYYHYVVVFDLVVVLTTSSKIVFVLVLLKLLQNKFDIFLFIDAFHNSIKLRKT